MSAGISYYRVCGLTLASDIAFPELAATDLTQMRDVDLRLWMAPSPATTAVPGPEWFITWTLTDGTQWLSCARLEDGYLLRFPVLADFHLDVRGTQTVCRPATGTGAATVRHLFLDQVVPLILNLRGGEALHATSVLTPFGACAFAGPAGAGKSTLAAEFMRAGAAVLSDDCLALQMRAGVVSVLPSYSGVRLWDESRAALFGDTDAASEVAQYTSKKRIAANSLPQEPRPLVRVYILQWADANATVTIEPLSHAAALMELVKYAFRLDVFDRVMLRRQFRFLEQAALRVPVRRLHLPDDLSRLGEVHTAIFADLAQTESQGEATA
jgi:hypothetical protein